MRELPEHREQVIQKLQRSRRTESESDTDLGFLTSEIRFRDPSSEIGSLTQTLTQTSDSRTPCPWVPGMARAR